MVTIEEVYNISYVIVEKIGDKKMKLSYVKKNRKQGWCSLNV